jgi:hypothetical protein
VTAPTVHPETVEVLLDTTWRVTEQENSRTQELDRKATSLATFVSLILALTASLGSQLLQPAAGFWLIAIFAGSLVCLIAAVALAAWVLTPKEHLSLGMAYLERFPTWSQLRKRPEQVRGEALTTLIAAVALERKMNGLKARLVRWGFALLLLALVLLVVQAAILELER